MNVRGVKNKPKKQTAKTKSDNPAQSAKFIAAAKSLGLDESNPAFERAMDKLVPRNAGTKK